MPDAFAGAEGAVDSQKASALSALAAFGRRGLEAAVAAQNEGNKVQSDAAAANTAFGNQMNIGSAGQAELAQYGAPAAAAYATNGQQASSFIASENDAAAKVNSNFYDQVKQSVPLARTSAAQMVDEYRAAYQERRAAAAAQAQRDQMDILKAAMDAQAEREQAAYEASIFNLDNSPNRQFYGSPDTIERQSAATRALLARIAAQRSGLTARRNF